MKAGLDLGKGEVYLVTGSGGLNTMTSMTAKGARVLAEQLIACADTLDNATENGWLDAADEQD